MSQYTRTTIRPGVVLNHRTIAMLRVAEQRLGVTLPIVQGSYNAGKVAASAGTHDGGGAVDVPPGVPGATADQIVLALRRVGFAAWHRLPSQGPWGEHVHAVAIGDKELSASARQQVTDYRAAENGLANHGHDDGPRINIRPWGLVRRVIAVREAERDLAKWKREHQ